MESQKELLSVNEAATFLRVDTETIYRWLNAGKLPGRKIGGIWRIPRSYINDLFKKEPDGLD